MSTDDKADVLAGMTILNELEEKLKNWSPSRDVRPSNAYTPTYKSFRMERLTAEKLYSDVEYYSKYINRLLNECDRAEPKIAGEPQLRRRFHFVKARIHALAGMWQQARFHYEKALENGYLEGAVRYYIAITYDPDGSEAFKAIENLNQVIDLSGKDSELGREAAKHINKINSEPPLPKREATSGKGCFIATAVYGSQFAPEIMAFRRFRDDVLITSRLGKCFVGIYYIVSPPLASLISKHQILQTLTRRFLLEPILHCIEKRR